MLDSLTNLLIFVTIPITQRWEEVSDPTFPRELPVGARQWKALPKYLPEWLA